jgi:YbgC/YbaW family acyl-CoA thioester hydrolase
MSAAEFDSIEGRFAFRVHWGDCDPAGIIFYPTYFRWMDAATWLFFESVGYAPARFRAERRAMPLVRAECHFRAPALQGDRCEVRSRIARFGGKSFVVAHRIVRDDGALLAEGSETRVWGRHAEESPGAPLRGETIPEAVKRLFLAPQPGA